MEGSCIVSFKPDIESDTKDYVVSYCLTAAETRKAVEVYVSLHFQSALRGNTSIPGYIYGYSKI